MNTDIHQDTMIFQQEREAFFDSLDRAAAANAEHNRGLSEEEILAIIEQAREETTGPVHSVTAQPEAPATAG